MTIRGFTLIELSLVVVILSILTSWLLFYGTGYIARTRHERARYDIRIVIDALKRFHYYYPQRRIVPLRELEPHFLAKLPLDPWDHEYRFNSIRSIVQSAGPDGKYDTRDDLFETYPTPRTRLVLVRDTRKMNSIVHIKIKGQLRTSLSPFQDRNSVKVDPVSFVSHYRSEYDFYLNCGSEKLEVTCEKTQHYKKHNHYMKVGDVYHILNMGIFTGDVTRREKWNSRLAYGAFEREYLFIPARYVPTIVRYFEYPHGRNLPDRGFNRLPRMYTYISSLGPFGFSFFCSESKEDKPVVEIQEISMWTFDDLAYWMFAAVPYYSSRDGAGNIRNYYQWLPERLGYDDVEAICTNNAKLKGGVIKLW